MYDEEIKQVISNVPFPANHSNCVSQLKSVLFIQKCIKCTSTSKQWRITSYDSNESQEFCNNCSPLPFNGMVEPRLRPHWLTDLTCLSFDKLFEKQHTTNDSGEVNVSSRDIDSRLSMSL